MESPITQADIESMNNTMTSIGELIIIENS